MKKLITLLIIVSMFCWMPKTNILAESISYSNIETQVTELDWENDGYENVILKNRVTDQDLARYNVPSVELDFIISKTGTIVHFERIGDIGYYYENDELIATVEYNIMGKTRATIPNSIKSLNFSAGNGFSNYYYAGHEDWVARQLADLTRDQIISLIIATICGNLPAYVVDAAVSLYGVASNLYTLYKAEETLSDDSLRAVNVYYGSYNGQCNILAWYGFKVYMLYKAGNPEINTATGQEFKANPHHTWNGSPYDYSQPSACRVLVNNYSY